MVRSFGLPQNHDPLQLSKFYLDTCSILDECYRQVLAGPSIGPCMIPMHIALNFSSDADAKTLLDICRVCNIADPHLVKRYLQGHSFLVYTKVKYDEAKCILTYHAPPHLHSFFLNPGRSRHLYSAPWILRKCWDGLECALGMRLKNDALFAVKFAFSFDKFFLPGRGCQISSASLMLSTETIKNGSDSESLLGFLKLLSRIPWLDICFDCDLGEICTQSIARWVCVALVS